MTLPYDFSRSDRFTIGAKTYRFIKHDAHCGDYYFAAEDDDEQRHMASMRSPGVTCHGLFPPSVTRVRPNERTDEDEEGTTDRGTDYRYPSGA